MTAEDDAYASEWYVELEALAETAGVPASELRWLMLADRLPPDARRDVDRGATRGLEPDELLAETLSGG